MGKRSNAFQRRKNDFYETPFEAVAPLIPHLNIVGIKRYIEPCAGHGALIDHLNQYGLECIYASDVNPAPRGRMWHLCDATVYKYQLGQHCFITNPPWTREILHPIILNLSEQAPTWLLFDADWAHTKQSIPYLKRCEKIVSVGRVKWIKDSPHTGKDNCAWYLFNKDENNIPLFYGRT